MKYATTNKPINKQIRSNKQIKTTTKGTFKTLFNHYLIVDPLKSVIHKHDIDKIENQQNNNNNKEHGTCKKLQP